MKIDRVSTSSLASMAAKRYDLVVLASGYEARCRDLGVQLNGIRIQFEVHTLVFAFSEYTEIPERKASDRILGAFSSRWEVVSEKDGVGVERIFIEEVNAIVSGNESVRIFVDISSMSRPWYAGVVRALRSIDVPGNIVVDFGYTVGKFEGVRLQYPPSEIVCPLQGFSATESPELPTALVLAVGYDSGRGLGLREYLDPELTIVLKNGNRTFEGYPEAVEQANADLFEVVNSDEVFEYDIADPGATFYTIASLCGGLAGDWRVVLASVGPKILGLTFLLLGAYDPRFSVWRVSGGAKVEPRNIVGEQSILLQTIWKSPHGLR